jgi:tetratricopeptide (TPR) repeat protein
VPARTSSFYFKGKSEDIAAIAQKLRVAYVLEGSVRKAGNYLRVTAQLIRAEDGYHLWSETYDRDLKDVFKVQDEIAAAVVTALKLKLASLQPTSSRHTSNIEAYNEVLLAREYFHRNTLDGFRRAGDAARKAVALDPNYAEAYPLLAYAEYVVGALREGDPAGLAKAKTMAMAIADKAVALAPDQAYGYAARGYIRFNSWEWAGAQADYKEALTIDPGEAATQPGYATLLASLGRLPEAIAAMRKACELDPLAGNPWNKLLHFLTSSRDFVAAEEAMNHALEVAPESPSILWNSANLVQLKGNTREALMMFRKIDVESNRLSGIAIAEYSLGNAKESQQAVDELIAKHAQDSAYFIALVYAWRGEKDKAFEWLERAFQRHAFNLTWIKFDWSFDSLRDDPRYKALLHKMNLPE